MENNERTARFVGGPIDGQTRQISTETTTYKHEQPPVSDDIRLGEVPVGFFPPMHEYIYQEQPAGSGTFVLVEEQHQ